ncbi:mannonate dehydratase [Oribacterium sp. HCP28S3_H8]|uniref:mannonate dehydratase n=1 Tax=Oribacterium sp. HCP28S3_H8 TaxID=3438945 RepID=UPI003F8BA1BD
MSLRPQVPVRTADSDDTLRYIEQMGIEYVGLSLKESEVLGQDGYDIIMRQKERFAKYNLKVSDATVGSLQKNKAIHLNLPNRDAEINKFQKMLEVFAKAEIPFTSIAWQPNGILRTDHRVGKYTRGGKSAYCDADEILARPNAEKRAYTEDEIWENFKYFMDQVIPVAEDHHIRLALHPNDPPIACMAGIPSLIYNMECYRRAFKAAHGSKTLGIKLCTGCWLEGGSAFGDIFSDIKELCAEDRILCVHFRNVSAPLPRFEETLAEDGYADMYAIMKQLIQCNCNAVISVDHAFEPLDGFGGMMGSFAYPTGFMKGLIWAIEKEQEKISPKK